jgi:uncharacterized phage-associated protein
MKKNQEKYTASHIANYFLWKAWKEGVEITPLKLIKLVYIAYGWNLVLNKDEKRKRLFEERIEAWKYGPVIPSLYHEFKRFGNNPIKEGYYATAMNETPMVRSDDSGILKILNSEWRHYKDKSGVELSAITHEGKAWHNAYYKDGANSVLNDDDIKARAIEGISEYLRRFSPKKDDTTN